MKLIDMINNSIQIEKNIKQPKPKPKKRKKQAKELGDTKSKKFSEV